MPRLYQILWSLVILFIIVTTVIFSFWILVLGAVVVSLYRLYHYFIGKKRPNKFKGNTTPRGNTPPRGYSSGEVIDMPVEILDRPSDRPRNE